MNKPDGPQLPVFLVGDDNSTRLIHFKVTSLEEQLIRAYVASPTTSLTLRRFADQCLELYLRVRSALHDRGQAMIYEAAPRSTVLLGIFASRSRVLELQAWAEFDDQEHRAAYHMAVNMQLRYLLRTGQLNNYITAPPRLLDARRWPSDELIVQHISPDS